MIQFVDVSKKFQRKTVLENINLTIQQGEFVYIVGPSGAGKSTLIQLLYRQLLPSKGIIWVNQFDLTKMKPKGYLICAGSWGLFFKILNYYLN
ncbi:cell division transporter, ATP-binding protein FtsE [Agrilactobacillus composti DSM 18527 = JCM 14202]|nr:cell division transporter, ATP-binding protein FtsE [Agrilactobacillus composti DSM 18527 = JCM 14202]